MKLDWWLYSGSAESYAGFPPAVMMFKTQFWVATFTPPTAGVWYECNPMPWSAGDNHIGYQSEIVTVGSHDLQFGAIGRLESDWFMNWKWAVWDNGTDQIPWGWHDQPSHYPWFPGDVQLIFTSPPAGGSIYPVGNVETKGKPWPP